MQKLPWFRIWSEARTDLKLATLSPPQHLVWFNLLCLASEQEDRGAVAMRETLLAIEVARGDAGLLRETLEVLRDLGIVSWEDGPVHAIRFLAFERRQSIQRKPSDAPERVRERVQAFRERERNARETPVKRPVTPRNAPVTPRNAEETRETPRRREEEKKNHPPLAPPPCETPGVSGGQTGGREGGPEGRSGDGSGLAAAFGLTAEPSGPAAVPSYLPPEPEGLRQVETAALAAFPRQCEGGDWRVVLRQATAEFGAAWTVEAIEAAADELSGDRRAERDRIRWSYLRAILLKFRERGESDRQRKARELRAADAAKAEAEATRKAGPAPAAAKPLPDWLCSAAERLRAEYAVRPAPRPGAAERGAELVRRLAEAAAARKAAAS